MRVLGICRFSYPALGGFKRMHDTVAAREAYLYDPARMELRFRHFETLTLPSIAAQRDKRFTFLIVIGHSLPAIWRDRLHDMTTDIPQIKIVAKDPMKHRLAMQLALQEELAPDDTDSIQFRLDDDDAVGVDFIGSIRRLVRDSRPVRARWRNLAIEYNSGYSVNLSADGILSEPVLSPFWACGLAVWFRPGDRKTVMNFAHHKLHHVMPTLIQPMPAMYLRAKHDDNDSWENYQTGLLQPLTDDERALFKSRFNVDEDHVKAVFSVPAVPRDKA